MTTPKSTLFLIDGMALAYRAHFAFIQSRLTNPEGIPTGPILGFANTLDKLLDDERPSHIAVAWDTHGPTFRHVIDEQYKANRPPQPDDLRTGIPLIKEMVEHYGIRNLEMEGFEADDIIGTLASKANAEDVDVWLVTPDKDFMQLVHDHIRMLKPDNANGGFIPIGREEVKDYFGVYPDKVIDVLAIIGDASDNVPGVPGIGKKGAPELIERFGSLEQAIARADEITAKKQREGLQQHAELAMKAKTMVTIHTDVPGVPPWMQLTWNGPDRRALAGFFSRMAFRTLTRKYQPTGETGNLFGEAEADGPVESGHAAVTTLSDRDVVYRLVSATRDLEDLAAELSRYARVCIDTETDHTDPMRARLVGLSFAVRTGEAWYVPVNVEGALPERQVLDALKGILEDPDRTWIAQNYKYDWLVLLRSGVRMEGACIDTMVAGYLLDASQELKMDALSRTYLGYDPIPITRLIGEGRQQRSMAELAPEDVRDYACEDADVTLWLADAMEPLIRRDGLSEVAYGIDFPLVTILGRMEHHGIRIDREMLADFSSQLEADMETVRTDIFELAGMEFNIQSPQQLGEILFERLKLPSGRKTGTGRHSTSEEVLDGLAPLHPLPARILDYRSLAKLKSTYADALPAMIDPATGRVHTSFNQTVAATGRLSSSNPNLQNIPVRTQRGREIRRAFIAREGCRLLSADYSQVELRIIASMSEDAAMIKAFHEGEDIHARTATEIFALDSVDEVTKDHRRKAKEVNFGIPYGVSAYGLATRLGISNGEGKEMIDRYFERFPGVRGYIDRTLAFALEHGYVTTLSGRRRYIPDIRSGRWNQRGFAERTAINMPIQGTAADIIKLAMISIDRMLKETGSESHMLLQVHDELVFEIHEREIDWLPERIRELMESAYGLKVPLKVDMGIGDNWLDAH